MKKRVVAMALSLMMAASMLAGCGGDRNSGEKKDKETASEKSEIVVSLCGHVIPQ